MMTVLMNLDDMDREEYKKVLIQALPTLTEEQIEKIISEEEHRKRNIKEGDNVFSLKYFENVITEKEIIQFNNEFERSGIQISFYDDTGVIKNSAIIDEFVTIYIKYELEKTIVQGIAFLIFQNLVVRIWRGIKKAKNFRVTSTTVTPYRLGFRIIISFAKRKSIEFIIPKSLKKSDVLSCTLDLQRQAELIDKEESLKSDNYRLKYKFTNKGKWKLVKI